MNKLFHILCQCFFLSALLLLASCGTDEKRYVIGVSQCSEDTWREKLNEELRVAALYYDNIDLRIQSAGDDVRLQTEQINRFVDEGVDLLIVAPGQVSISPAIDRAYEKGIPVIVFDRRTRSDKYTAYIGADNKEIGESMANFISANMSRNGTTRVLELCGLSSSSPAIERRQGFDSIASLRPNVSIVGTLHSDWTEQGALRTMDSLLSHPHPGFDCVFAHNDRMAIGARKAAKRHGLDVERIKFCGIDAMPQQGGGMALVADSTLFASYIYPTRGDEVMKLAVNILTGRPFNRENRLSSALVTADNARVLLMQNEETMRQQAHLSTLRGRVNKASADFKAQRTYLLVMIVFVVLLFVVCAFAIYAYVAKARINHQLKDSMGKQEAMTREMEQMTQTQLQFFTNVSHELRTPLTLIAGPTEQLLGDPTLRESQRSMLEMVRRNTRILIQLVGEILDFRKVQNNKAVLKLSRFCLSKELKAWAADFKTVAARHNITLEVDVSDVDAGTMVIADRDKLEHIYFNLMSNALKYTHTGGHVTTTLRLTDSTFTLLVSDDGKGVEPQELPHLFERFYQAKGSVGGTGIGLSLVKAYVDLHNGSVRAESTQGKGTTIIVELPVEQPGYNPGDDSLMALPHDLSEKEHGLIDDSYVNGNVGVAEAAERITNAEDFDKDKPLVLVVDDNQCMRTYLRSILAPKYNVAEAADGKQGLERARREVPKLIVSDVMMPVMDGLELTRHIKEDTATCHIPVVLLTARSLGEQRGEGYEVGADSYLTKPFSGDVLLARIDNLLRSRNLLRSIFAGNKKEEEEENLLGEVDKSFVDQIRDVIKRNMADSDFSVERLGEEIGLSRVQLYRKVKALTGMTPVELLRKARLERARQLIEKTERSISEIAYEVGFSAPSYFNKCFRDEFGVSPGGLRP